MRSLLVVWALAVDLFVQVVNGRNSEICWDKFDMNYRNQCLNGRWEQRFYFDHASLTCRQFWFDGCRSDSRNMFEDVLTCQWLCESQPMYKSRACLEDFDTHYKEQCNGGRWRQQFYFDKNKKQCVPFWYDGCTGESENIFQNEQTCLMTCEDPAKKDPRKPWHNNDKHKMKEKLNPIFRPNITNICETKNPCRNNGTCHFSVKKNSYHCNCAPGFTGTNCGKREEFDPCASAPCLNGATCKAKFEKGKSSYECYCAVGYGGPMCDQKPCDSNPCKNNGTCRTTRGFSTYFCDCPTGFGGKDCDIAIGSTPPETFGKNVEMVSSGKAEWVNEMKARLAKQQSTGTKQDEPSADEPYKDPKQKKREREQKEKEIAEELSRKEEEEKEVERKKEEQQLEEERKFNETRAAKETSSSLPLSILSSLIVLLVTTLII